MVDFITSKYLSQNSPCNWIAAVRQTTTHKLEEKMLTIDKKMPGVRCPACKNRGQEVWVVPGTKCHKCGCAC